MIAVVDTGGANLASVGYALERLGVQWQLTQNAEVIRSSPRVLLPGVGAAEHCMARLRDAGLVDVVRGLPQPVLGICLGMQLLFASSEEGGGVPCLGVIPGDVTKLRVGPGVAIPHMGWNTLDELDATCPLLAGIPRGSSFYFVHSFRAPAGPAVVATSHHGESFPAAVQANNFFGVQFHPERSGAWGEKLLRNFLQQ